MTLEECISGLGSEGSRERILQALENNADSSMGVQRHVFSLLHDALHWSSVWPKRRILLDLVTLAQRPGVGYATIRNAVLRTGLRISPPGLR